MLNYEDFKNAVQEQIINYIDNKENYYADIHSVQKANGLNYDAVCIPPKESVSGIHTLPTMNINVLYEAYKSSGDLDEVIKYAAEQLTRSAKFIPPSLQQVSSLFNDESKNKIIFDVINTEANENMLKDIPSRKFMDLSVIYKVYVGKNQNSSYSTVTITNDMAERMNLSEEQLYNLAYENTKKILPSQIICMEELIMQQIPEMADLLENISPEEKSYIITNECQINGAVNMLYTENLDKIAKTFDSDLYVIPSSIHEVIVFTVKNPNLSNPQESSEFIQQTNQSTVEQADRLSNQLYRYDAKSKELSIASDSSLNRDIKDVEQPRRRRGR